MSTVRQVKKLLTPLAARHDDLELVGFTLYLKPMEDDTIADATAYALVAVRRYAFDGASAPSRG